MNRLPSRLAYKSSLESAKRDRLASSERERARDRSVQREVSERLSESLAPRRGSQKKNRRDGRVERRGPLYEFDFSLRSISHLGACS